MSDQATHCDECLSPIYYGERAWLLATGEVIDGTPVVLVMCDPCYEEESR